VTCLVTSTLFFLAAFDWLYSLFTMKNIEQNNTASAREAAEDGISENSRPELGARTKQWSDFGVSLGQIEAWALALSWNLVMSSIFSMLESAVRPSLSQSIIHRLTMAYTKPELHLSSGPRQPLTMTFACATKPGCSNPSPKSPYFGHRNEAPCSAIYLLL
jgi:hypothetical protein